MIHAPLTVILKPLEVVVYIFSMLIKKRKVADMMLLLLIGTNLYFRQKKSLKD